MSLGWSTKSTPGLLPSAVAEVVFLGIFSLVVLNTRANSTIARAIGWLVLLAVTHEAEKSIIQACLASERPHWAATTASLLWVQFLSASELLLVSRVDAYKLRRYVKRANNLVRDAASVVGLLWNMRRVGTPWQVKNVPSTAGQLGQSRAGFILRRLAVTLVAYVFVDVVVSMPPPDPALVQINKATLFSLHTMSTDDVIFRIAMTISYWIITGVLNLFMNNLGAAVTVLLGLAKPVDCPPLYGSFLDAFTVRRFWGVTWHQMFRSFLTGHADLIVDNTLPFISRHTRISRYTRLAIAFFVSGAIHYRGDQIMGIPDNQNGAVIFFLMHAAAIMLEDILAPIASAVIPKALCRVLGWAWVLSFFIWSSPIWIYSSTRVGLDSAALLPVRIVGPWINVSN